MSKRLNAIWWILSVLIIFQTSMQADGIERESFIKRLYVNIFEREADEGGLNYWKSELENGKTAADVAKYFFTSKEISDLNLNDEAFLTRAYTTLLNREPDQSGFAYWLDQMQTKGVLRDQIFYGFALSPEFKNLSESYGIKAYSKENQLTAFINRFYNLILQRESDPGGMDNWTNALIGKTKSPDDIAKDFFFSSEFLDKNVNDETFIKILYRTLMNREADEAGLTHWKAQLKKRAARMKVLEEFLAAQEFKNICAQFLNNEEEQPLQKPNPPTNLTKSNVTADSLTITWSDNSNNESGFKIYRESKNRVFAPIHTAGANETTFTDTGLEPNRRYSYQVRAYNAQGESELIQTSTVTQALHPAFLHITVNGCAEVRLAWGADSIYDQFNIYRSGILVGQTGPGVEEYIDLMYIGEHTVDDPCGQTFTYTVRAVNSAGVENGSDAGASSGSITTPSAPPPGSPPSAPGSGSSACCSGTNTITINWSDNSNNESGFRIYRERQNRSRSFTLIHTTAANVTTYTDTDVTPGTTYKYEVRAYSSYGESGGEVIEAAAASGSISYTYDTAGRLIKTDYGDGNVIEYSYDKNGNLIQRDEKRGAL